MKCQCNFQRRSIITIDENNFRKHIQLSQLISSSTCIVFLLFFILLSGFLSILSETRTKDTRTKRDAIYARRSFDFPIRVRGPFTRSAVTRNISKLDAYKRSPGMNEPIDNARSRNRSLQYPRFRSSFRCMYFVSINKATYPEE